MQANLARSNAGGGGEFTTFLFTPTEITATITIPELAGKQNASIVLREKTTLQANNIYAVLYLSIKDGQVGGCTAYAQNQSNRFQEYGFVYTAETGTLDFSSAGTSYSRPMLFLAQCEYVVTCW